MLHVVPIRRLMASFSNNDYYKVVFAVYFWKPQFSLSIPTIKYLLNDIGI